MTKEITKARIMQEIEDRFKLRELDHALFSFSETVVPIYDINAHLLKQRSTYFSVSITAIGGYTFFAVPPDERWVLNRYDVVFMGAGAHTVAGAYTRRFPDLIDVYLDLTAGQSASYHVELPKPVVLDPGDKLQINVDGYTSTQALRLYIDYIEEKIR